MKSKRRVTKRRKRTRMHGGAAKLFGFLMPSLKKNQNAENTLNPEIEYIRGKIKNIELDSALMSYSAYGYLDGVKEEIKKNGTKINEITNTMTALMTASQNGHINVVEYLLEQGADPNVETTHVFRNALTIAAYLMRLDVMKTLLTFKYNDDKKINVNSGNQHNCTPLMYVINYFNNDPDKSLEIINLLLKNGADVNMADDSNNTALSWAIKHKNDLVVRLLLENIEEDNRNQSATKFNNEAYSSFNWDLKMPLLTDRR